MVFGLLIVLFLAAVFLAASEAALLRVRRVSVQLEAVEGNRRAAVLLNLLDHLPRAMNTVLLTVLLAQIGAATVAGVISDRYFGSLGVTLTSIALTIVLFIYAEAIPKTYAVRHPLRVALATVPVLRALDLLLRPVVVLLLRFVDLQAPGRGVTSHVGVTETELRALAAEAAEVGAIGDSDFELMERAFRLGDTRVEEIFVPRPEVVAVEAATPLHDALQVCIDTGHRRLPVQHGDLDHLTGVANLRDLAAAVARNERATVGAFARPLLAVPQGIRVVDLLRDMQTRQMHLAVVVDEHGGTTGIVTIEDVAEELVGAIADEGEVRAAPVRVAAPGRWIVEGRAGVDELENVIGVELPRGDWLTVAGLVVAQFGSIPRRGDVIELAGCRFVVMAASRRRVELLEVCRIEG